jgi:hypothetical protein
MQLRRMREIESPAEDSRVVRRAYKADMRACLAAVEVGAAARPSHYLTSEFCHRTL